MRKRVSLWMAVMMLIAGSVLAQNEKKRIVLSGIWELE